MATGIRIRGSQDISIVNCRFDGLDTGIDAADSRSIHVSGNTFARTQASRSTKRLTVTLTKAHRSAMSRLGIASDLVEAAAEYLGSGKIGIAVGVISASAPDKRACFVGFLEKQFGIKSSDYEEVEMSGESIGIKMKNVDGADIQNNTIRGYQTGIDAENIKRLTLRGNLVIAPEHAEELYDIVGKAKAKELVDALNKKKENETPLSVIERVLAGAANLSQVGSVVGPWIERALKGLTG